jgi:hypothetical protein
LSCSHHKRKKYGGGNITTVVDRDPGKKKKMSKKILNLQQLLKKISKQCQISPLRSAGRIPERNQTNLQQILENENWGQYLQQIQLILQQDEQHNINDLIHCLLIELTKDHHQIRMTMIDISDYFFHLSSKFRQQLCQQLTEFVSGIIPLCIDNLPPSELRNHLLRVIAEWDYDFGRFHPQLRAFTRYLKESLRYALPDISVRLPIL